MGIGEHKSVIDLAEAGRFALLIDAVVDYAIFMLDEKGFVRTWNPGGRTDQGLSAIRNYRAAFFTVLLA